MSLLRHRWARSPSSFQNWKTRHHHSTTSTRQYSSRALMVSRHSSLIWPTSHFREGRFPDRFKIAQVTPLIKNDGLDVNDPANYRPISNLNTISKIIERLCLARLTPHIAATGHFQPVAICLQKASTALWKQRCWRYWTTSTGLSMIGDRQY